MPIQGTEIVSLGATAICSKWDGSLEFPTQTETFVALELLQVMVLLQVFAALGSLHCDADNHDGFIFHNTLTNAALEIGGTSIVVSANMIVPGFGTGIVSEGLDGAGDPISEYNTFQGNTVSPAEGLRLLASVSASLVKPDCRSVAVPCPAAGPVRVTLLSSTIGLPLMRQVPGAIWTLPAPTAPRSRSRR